MKRVVRGNAKTISANNVNEKDSLLVWSKKEKRYCGIVTAEEGVFRVLFTDGSESHEFDCVRNIVMWLEDTSLLKNSFDYELRSLTK